MATEGIYTQQLQALATATANYANGKDAQIKQTIIQALGDAGGGSTGKTEGVIIYDKYPGLPIYNGDGLIESINSGNKTVYYAQATANYTAAVCVVEGNL